MSKGFFGLYPTMPDAPLSRSAIAALNEADPPARVELCPDCGIKSIKPGYRTCYRCHVNGFGVNWHGGGFLYGRDNFSSRTNAEYINEHVDTTNAAHIGSLDWKDI